MAVPNYLYKYRPLTSDFHWTCVEQILLGGRLYFPSPVEFNDPFDCAPVPVVHGNARQIRTGLMRLSFRMEPHLNRNQRRQRVAGWPQDRPSLERLLRNSLKESVNSVGVLSLSANRDQILMWSHYAGSHTGCCLRFRSDGPHPYFQQAFVVKYAQDRPQVDMLRESYQARLEKSLLTKADFWEYEAEYRIFEYQRPPGAYAFPAQTLDGIILGSRIPQAAKERLLGLVNQRAVGTEILQADIDPSMFRISVAAP